jgi:hypothetical protein
VSAHVARSALAALALALALLSASPPARAWNVTCFDDQGAPCKDPYGSVQTPWLDDAQAEHRAILARTLELAGLPASIGAPFDLTVFTNGQEISATVAEPEEEPETFTYTSVRPVRSGARERRLRAQVSVPAMANLPDFSYSLWDWAAGNELCPPAPGSDAVDCHNYENHMLPQARHFYEYLHGLALDRADRCKETHDAMSAGHRPRFTGYLLACEKLALVIEAVAHHYLQDAWAEGHMWERWGGSETSDFGGNRTLGFAIAGFVGSIHGSKAVLDEDPLTSALAPWDDPMNGPHAEATYVDPVTGLQQMGAGDMFLDSWMLGPVPHPIGSIVLDPQRKAMLGCAVDGVREVYERTARVHGALVAADAASIDGTRDVQSDACWNQRATNKALALGCGIHQGAAPGQQRLLPGGITSILFWALADAEARGLPPLGPELTLAFQTDAAYACTLAMAAGLVPIVQDQTNLASGGLPSIAGVQPNSAYAQGGAGDPPTSWADPELPWSLEEVDPAIRERNEALNLTFADAHAADRCHDQSEADLLELRNQVDVGNAGGDLAVMDARCGQCVQQVAPHLRRGPFGDHDPNREAFCALAGVPGAAFVYSDEDPSTFPGAPIGFPALRTATRAWCHCDGAPTPTPAATPAPTPGPTSGPTPTPPPQTFFGPEWTGQFFGRKTGTPCGSNEPFSFPVTMRGILGMGGNVTVRVAVGNAFEPYWLTGSGNADAFTASTNEPDPETHTTLEVSGARDENEIYHITEGRLVTPVAIRACTFGINWLYADVRFQGTGGRLTVIE